MTNVARVESVQNSDNLWLTLPEDLWEKNMLKNNSRFDWIVQSDDSLVLRPCPMSFQEWEASGFRHGHPDDPSWTKDSYCGLTKWVCPTCGIASIVANEDDFPPNWVEMSTHKESGDTLGLLVFCSMKCLAQKANELAQSENPLDLPPWQYPGFENQRTDQDEPVPTRIFQGPCVVEKDGWKLEFGPEGFLDIQVNDAEGNQDPKWVDLDLAPDTLFLLLNAPSSPGAGEEGVPFLCAEYEDMHVFCDGQVIPNETFVQQLLGAVVTCVITAIDNID